LKAALLLLVASIEAGEGECIPIRNPISNKLKILNFVILCILTHPECTISDILHDSLESQDIFPSVGETILGMVVFLSDLLLSGHIVSLSIFLLLASFFPPSASVEKWFQKDTRNEKLIERANLSDKCPLLSADG
jgi:hypothetical protein